MATTFPEAIQDFTPALDITATDGALIAQYQQAKMNGEFALAAQILSQIPQAGQKTITAGKLNTIFDTCRALEDYFLQRFSPAYVVSETEPTEQEIGDFWFEVTD